MLLNSLLAVTFTWGGYFEKIWGELTNEEKNN